MNTFDDRKREGLAEGLEKGEGNGIGHRHWKGRFCRLLGERQAQARGRCAIGWRVKTWLARSGEAKGLRRCETYLKVCFR
jgi:hypothetical protein